MKVQSNESSHELQEYFINLDERGEFSADIRTLDGETVFEIDTEYAQFLSDEGVKLRCVTSVWSYLRSVGHIESNIILKKAN